MLLEHFHLPVENIPQRFNSDLSLETYKGSCSLDSSLGWDRGAIGQAPGETQVLSEPNPLLNPSHATEVAKPRRSPGLWKAGMVLGFVDRKPIAIWLLVAFTVT